jgi:FMN phosphatase YigB (HAD superfamily)
VRIGFDVDGVFYRLTKAYHLWINQKLGMNLDPELEAQTYHWFQEWESRDEFLVNLHEAVDAGEMFWKGDLYEPQISQNLKDLKAAGHTIHVVTARFSGVSKCSQEATRHFFQQNDLIYDTMTFSWDKTVVETDIFLEDHIKNYDALEAAGITSYLVNRPYNDLQDNRRRVDTVDEFTGLILENAWQSLDSVAAH